MKNTLYHYWALSRKKVIFYRERIFYHVDRQPIQTFFTLLGLLLLLIIIGNILRKPKVVQKTPVVEVKAVKVYQIGSAPKITVQAQVEKSGVVTITSLTAGVVQNIFHKEGEHVTAGQTLVSLSSNYQGGNALSLQRQLAQRQLNGLQQQYPINKDIIAKQRELANKTEENASDLRTITAQSIDETQSLINLNNEILSTLDQNLRQYEASNSAGTNNVAILQTKQLKSQFQSANNQLNSALRSNQYQSSDTNPPADMARLQRDVALRQLDLQEKALELNLAVSRLQVQIAQVNEAMMFPAAPFSATVQRVLVKVGQAVTPGTPLVILSQDIQDDPIIAIAYVPNEIARKVSTFEPSILHIADFTYDAYPSYVTQDAIQGTLYGVYFPIPDNYSRYVTEKGYIQVEIPVGYFDTLAAIPFIPIDAVYQTQDEAYVFVVNKQGKVESHTVELGEVYGRFVEVKSGLKNGDRVILDRNVIAGDVVKVQ